MRNVLEDLYFGEAQPNTDNYDTNPRLKKAAQTLAENEEILLKLLDGKEKSLFLDYINAQGEVTGNSTVENFIHGFRLGAKIIIEAIVE